MSSNPNDKKEIELILIIVNSGLGSKVIKIAKKNGFSGGTIFLGKGTIQNRILEFLELNDIRKEVVLMVAEKTIAYQGLEIINKKLAFNKPNHGIAFTISVANLLGSRTCQYNNIKESKGGDTMHKAIFVIVDRGNAEDVIDAATKAGSRGGTIINARGSGIHETHTLFSMAIEPEKEIVMILSENDQVDAIALSVREHLQIDEPGKGILFILDVNKTYGLY